MNDAIMRDGPLGDALVQSFKAKHCKWRAPIRHVASFNAWQGHME